MRSQYTRIVVGLLVFGSSARAQPGPDDVKVQWEKDYPKKEHGKLKLKGKVTVANGWSTIRNSVIVTYVPKNGGPILASSIPLAANGTWSTEIPLNQFPMPKREYYVTPSVSAVKNFGDGRTFEVAGLTRLIDLP